MRLFESLRDAFTALRTNLLRSILTTLGIIIGVASVILMIAIAEGARSDVDRRISSLGTNLLQLRPGSKRVRGWSVGAEAQLPFSEGDINEISTTVEDIEGISGHFRRSGTVVYRGADWLTNLDGVHADYLIVRDWDMEFGRFFSKAEYLRSARVAVVGTTAARELFGGADPVGERIRIGSIPFTVLGVLEYKGANPSGRDRDDVVLVPLSTLRSRLVKRHKLVPDQVGYVSVKVADDESIPAAAEEIEAILRKRRKLRDNRSDNFYIRDVAAYQRAKTETQQTFSPLL